MLKFYKRQQYALKCGERAAKYQFRGFYLIGIDSKSIVC